MEGPEKSVLWMEKGVGKDKEGYLEASSTASVWGERTAGAMLKLGNVAKGHVQNTC